MSLAPGTRIGPCEVACPLGAGGPPSLAVDLPALVLAAAHPDGRIQLHNRVLAADSLTLIRDWQALTREGR